MATRGRMPLFGTLEELPTFVRHKNGWTQTAHVVPTPLGERLGAEWRLLHGRHPAVTASEFCVMPDHFHGLLMLDLDAAGHLGVETVIREFKERIGTDVWNEEKPFILTPFDKGSLGSVRRYIRRNPDRALWKRRHPDRFLRVSDLKHPVLPSDVTWTGLGNVMALASPFLVLMSITAKKPLEELQGAIANYVDLANNGHRIVSGFLSPAEREVHKVLRMFHLGPYVRLLPYGIPPKYDPSLEFSREVAEDGALLLSPFPETVPYGKVTRANCVVMNEVGRRIGGHRMSNGEPISPYPSATPLDNPFE